MPISLFTSRPSSGVADAQKVRCAEIALFRGGQEPQRSCSNPLTRTPTRPKITRHTYDGLRSMACARSAWVRFRLTNAIFNFSKRRICPPAKSSCIMRESHESTSAESRKCSCQQSANIVGRVALWMVGRVAVVIGTRVENDHEA